MFLLQQMLANYFILFLGEKTTTRSSITEPEEPYLWTIEFKYLKLYGYTIIIIIVYYYC